MGWRTRGEHKLLRGGGQVCPQQRHRERMQRDPRTNMRGFSEGVCGDTTMVRTMRVVQGYMCACALFV